VRTVGAHLGVIVAFALPAVVLWWHAWSGGPASTVRCDCLDPGQQVWFVAWPAYALLHGFHLFSTTWLWPSRGVNLLSNASSPLVGVVLAPVTWLFGPFVATTVALTLAPALSAYGCFLACRRVVSFAPAWWVGGLLFGYSPFVVENVVQGHLGLALLVVPPLVVVLLHEILVRRRWSPVASGVALGLLLFAQFLISQEILLLTLLAAAAGVVLAAAVSPRQIKAAFASALRASAIAAVVAGATLAYPVWFMLKGPEAVEGSIWNGAQVLFVSKAYDIWNAGHYLSHLASFPPGAGQGPPVEFLGIAVLAAAALALALAWRRRVVWVLAAVAVVTTVCSFGTGVWVSPTKAYFWKWLPWRFVIDRPVFENVEAVHFSAFADLALALIIAVGIGAAHSWSGWKQAPTAIRGFGVVALAGAVLAMVVPQWATYGAPVAVQKVSLPPWYATVGRTVPVGSVVASYPFPASAALESRPLVWQAADGMRFRLAGGYVKYPGPGQGVIGTGPKGSATWTLDALTSASAGTAFTPTPSEIVALRQALRRWQVSYVVVADTGPVPVEAAGLFTAVTGSAPRLSHRAWVWDLRAGRPPTPPAAAVEATSFISCRTPAVRLGAVSPDRALPQQFNRCIVRGVTASSS
jgi:hypothetical protein